MSTSPPTAPAHRRGPLLLGVGIVALLILSLLASSRRSGPDTGEFKILCSFLPVYVFAQNVVGDTPGVEVQLLLSPDLGCPHDYSLRPGDLVRVNRANLVLVNGLGAEPFMDTLLANKPHDQVLTIADDTQPIEAACTDPDHGHEAETEGSTEEAGHHHHDGPNPHVWASPLQAAREVRTLARKLAAADPAHAKRYHANAEHYAQRLESLGERMRRTAAGFKSRNIVTFHDAFAYLARDLDLNVVATLTVDPQNGASASQMGELDRIIREQHVAAIFYEPAYSDAAARTLAAQTGVPAFPLNPFNYAQGQPDATAYERVMEANLKTLEQALGTGS